MIFGGLYGTNSRYERKFEMLAQVIKRNGKTVRFDRSKIISVIAKASEATGEFNGTTSNMLADEVVVLVKETMKNHIPTVEEVQDAVEEVLLSSRYKQTAKAFILYRDQRAKMRDFAHAFNVDLVDQYISKLDWQVNENSNMSYSLQGLNNYLTTEISKLYWLTKVYPKEIRDAHQKGDFHIHDLGLLSVYCVGWDLFDLLC